MDFGNYKILAFKRQAQIMMVHDCNIIVDKLTRSENKGKSNPVWEEMPTLSSGQNEDDRIFDDIPYAIGLSECTADLLFAISSSETPSANGGFRCPIEILGKEILPLLSITTQFSLLEYFEVELYKYPSSG